MNAVWSGVDESFLAERRRHGLDGKDELWDGVLHMVPPPSFPHGNTTLRLAVALIRIGASRGLVASADNVGIFDRADNYRVPDASLARPDQIEHRGLRGAELVVEMLSPHDEARAKLPFFAQVGVREIWLVDPVAVTIEVLVRDGSAWVRIEPSGTRVRSSLLDVDIEIVDGRSFRIHDADDVIDV